MCTDDTRRTLQSTAVSQCTDTLSVLIMNRNSSLEPEAVAGVLNVLQKECI